LEQRNRFRRPARRPGREANHGNQECETRWQWHVGTLDERRRGSSRGEDGRNPDRNLILIGGLRLDPSRNN
jgi:hypothetical protein